MPMLMTRQGYGKEFVCSLSLVGLGRVRKMTSPEWSRAFCSGCGCGFCGGGVLAAVGPRFRTFAAEATAAAAKGTCVPLTVFTCEPSVERGSYADTSPDASGSKGVVKRALGTFSRRCVGG